MMENIRPTEEFLIDWRDILGAFPKQIVALLGLVKEYDPGPGDYLLFYT